MKRERKDKESDIRVLLDNPAFVRFLTDFFEVNSVTALSTNFDNQNITHFNNGRQSVSVSLFEQLKLVDMSKAYDILKLADTQRKGVTRNG